MAKKSFDHLIKIMLLGDASVGKTSTMLRFIDDSFAPSYISSIGVDFRTKTVKLKDQTIKLQLWDTAGQERFHTICQSYYRNAQAIIVMYDITESKSFENVSRWLRNIDENANENVVKLLVGNKNDREDMRKISYNLGHELAKSHGMQFFEISAKTNCNVSVVFEEIINSILNRKEKPKAEVSNKPTKLTFEEKKKSKCC